MATEITRTKYNVDEVMINNLRTPKRSQKLGQQYLHLKHINTVYIKLQLHRNLGEIKKTINMQDFH